MTEEISEETLLKLAGKSQLRRVFQRACLRPRVHTHQSTFFKPDDLREYNLHSWQHALLQLDPLRNKIYKENRRGCLLNGARRAEIFTDQHLRGVSYKQGVSYALAIF